MNGDSERMKGSDAGPVKSGARILDLVEYFAARRGPAGLADVVADLKIPKSSALMLLRTLVAKNYIDRDANGLYMLSSHYRHAEDGWVGGQVAVLRKLARPIMQTLALEVQETVVLGVLTPAFSVNIVEKVESPREVRYDIRVDADYPAYCTAMGRAILAHMDESVVTHYLRTGSRRKQTAKTTIDEEGLRTILAAVREKGYAVNIEEHLDGASSVAAPLFSRGGQIAGAVNVGCVATAFLANHEHIIGRLLVAARSVHERLSGMTAANPQNF